MIVVAFARLKTHLKHTLYCQLHYLRNIHNLVIYLLSLPRRVSAKCFTRSLLIVHRPRPFLASQRAQFFFPLPTLFVSSTPLPSFCLPSLSIETTMMRRMRFYYYYSILSLFFFLEQTRSNEAKFKFLVEYPIIESTSIQLRWGL